uniref:CMP/dCMP-type deaminase domain-containing protein n=1 Tax=Alexandrium andersonii TaxID=327968 RepID=A0A7S2D7M2_9DINO|mmetsp:Transcript_48689/g.110242  ORF Transcript_48689/g.110242 Transcript_48689/m.110242 type:complete len:208 (+) Transcript_48689:131-754(+)
MLGESRRRTRSLPRGPRASRETRPLSPRSRSCSPGRRRPRSARRSSRQDTGGVLNKAVRLCLERGGPSRYCMCAFVTCGGKVVAGPALCGLGSPTPSAFRVQAHRLGHASQTRHAEVAALAALPRGMRRRRLRHCHLVVLRAEEDPDGQIRLQLARPCRDCARLCCAIGVQKVTYSTEGGQLRTEMATDVAAESKPSSGTLFHLLHQ